MTRTSTRRDGATTPIGPSSTPTTSAHPEFAFAAEQAPERASGPGSPVPMTMDTLDRQRRYVEAQRAKGNGLGIVFADAFLRGMRDLGYKNPAWALAELLDNAFQARADTVAVRLSFASGNKSQGKPDQIAICDNGTGMLDEMLSYAVRWGGTDREGDRRGFGRYGYGLPSAAVSLARRYTVYSKTAQNGWNAVTVDISELADAAGDVERTKALLAPMSADPPAWVREGAAGDDKLDLGAIASGTVVVLEDLDRLRTLSGWIKADSFKTKLLQHVGVIYRHWIPERRVYVAGTAAQAVDPLFLMEHGRFYNETGVLARPVKARSFEVETSRGTTGTVTIRAALLPPNFQLAEPAQYGVKGAKNNKRFDVMKDYNGLLVCRERRQIDTVAPRWTSFQVFDRNIKIEVDFDPELDEYFGITTAKQQISIEDDMWEKLQHGGRGGGGLKDLVEDLRRERDKLDKQLKAGAQNRASPTDTPRPSGLAMQQSERFKGASPEPTPEQRAEAERNLDAAAETRAAVTGLPTDQVRKQLADETRKLRWEVEFTSIPEGPMYRPARLGEQKRLVINTDHPFYTKIYEHAAPDVRAALEVLLFVLAERELEVRNEAETFYKAERQRWSERLRHALEVLVSDESLVDAASMVAESMYATEADAGSGLAGAT